MLSQMSILYIGCMLKTHFTLDLNNQLLNVYTEALNLQHIVRTFFVCHTMPYLYTDVACVHVCVCCCHVSIAELAKIDEVKHFHNERLCLHCTSCLSLSSRTIQVCAFLLQNTCENSSVDTKTYNTGTAVIISNGLFKCKGAWNFQSSWLCFHLMCILVLENC